jgi:N6-adenosine-specific RNA methylase IME4
MILEHGHAPIKFHPLANLFPMLQDTELEDLGEDIRQNGQLEDVILHRDMILDGRNRYTAATRKGLPVRYEIFKGGDHEALTWVISKNLKRRHLTESQRAMVAARIATLRLGDNQHTQLAPIGAPLLDLIGDAEASHSEPPAIMSQTEASDLMNVGRRSVQRAATVVEQGIPDLQKAVEQDHIAVSAAAEIAARPVEEQKQILDALPRDDAGKLTPEAKKALAPIIKEVRKEKQTEKKQRRDDREAALGRKLLAMPEKKYGVAIEDLEWDHEPWSRDSGMDRHPSNHYPTAADAHTPEEIVARTAERMKCLADDLVFYMWTTIPHEAIAHEVLKLRGLKYVTQRVWGKERTGAGRGTGYWVTGEHEILLIAVRGKVVPPATAHFPSFFLAPVGEHSEKPDQQYEHAEFHFPTLPKIELNARRARPGWDAWGYEAPEKTLLVIEEETAA